MASSRVIEQRDSIGIFDSGTGGLTVASAIRHILPQENLVYFGDTAHLPYGDKSPDSIRYYSLRISKFLQEQSCKLIVIACNSASAVAYNTLKDFFHEDLFVNAVDPLVQKVIDVGYRNIGIIGTKATIESKTYEHKLRASKPQLKIHSLSTPLLVPLIEKELQDKELTKSVLQTYLERLPLEKMDVLLLACTHYPLIKELVTKIVPDHIEVLDSATPVAQLTYKVLATENLLNSETRENDDFFLSDVTSSFKRTAEDFFGEEVNIKKKNLWV